MQNIVQFLLPPTPKRRVKRAKGWAVSPGYYLVVKVVILFNAVVQAVRAVVSTFAASCAASCVAEAKGFNMKNAFEVAASPGMTLQESALSSLAWLTCSTRGDSSQVRCSPDDHSEWSLSTRTHFSSMHLRKERSTPDVPSMLPMFPQLVGWSL